MSSEIIADADHKMGRAVDAMERDFQGVRTGDFNQLGRFREAVQIRNLLNSQTHLLGYNATRPNRQVVSSMPDVPARLVAFPLPLTTSHGPCDRSKPPVWSHLKTCRRFLRPRKNSESVSSHYG